MGPISAAILRATLYRPVSVQLIRNISRSTNPLFDADAVPKVETSTNNDRSQALENAQSLKQTPGAGTNIKGIDPFGIEDLVNTSASSVVVQGFYGFVYPTKDKPQTQNQGDTSTVNLERKTEALMPNTESEKSAKLHIYDGWLKHREETMEKERIEGPAENYRATSFGNVRLDSDNVVRRHGQYDQVDPTHSTGRVPWKSKDFGGEREADEFSNNKMTAAEFLKEFNDEKAEEKANLEKTRTIDKSVNPRAVKQNLQAELDQISTSNYDQDYLDSNVIPKIYQLPEYNQLTKQDMWSIIKKSVIFNNDFIIAINKPPGISIHSPSVDCRHFITEFRDRLSDFGQCSEIYPIHRLDKETTGVLLFAKSPKVAAVISEKFANRQVDKRYLVITKLCPQMSEGTIKIPIGEGRAGGSEKFRSVLKPDLRKFEIKTRQGSCRDAITHFKVLKSTKDAAFLEVKPESGIKHQIRLHLGLGIGCPIIGDHKYSHRDRMAPQRLHPSLLHRLKVKQSKVRELPLHLHCSSISFTLPEEFIQSAEPVYVHAKVPRYFTHTLKAFGL